jgi:hypothetical protein
MVVMQGAVMEVAVMEVAAMAMVAWAFDLGGDSLLWREKIAIQYDSVVRLRYA